MSAMHIGEKDGENALSWSRRSDYHADPTDNDPSDPMDVCETCRTSILDHLQYYRDSAEEYHNTLESFIESVDKGCYICRSLYLTIPSDTREVLLAKESDTYHSLKWSYHPSFSPPLISIDGLIHTSSLNIYISLYRVQDQPPGVSLVAVKSGSTGSAQPLNQICRWLENCNTHHTTCSNELGDDKPWYPTRLLDLSSTDGRARIIETIETVPKGPYVTLSHCWGTIETPRTTRENLSKFKERLPKLTKTFEDAILVARKLNVDYMWIDSLCIIQGPDLEDWASESAQMSKIYQLALCNIAATASQDGRGGLFFTRAAISPCQVEIPTFLGPDRIWLVDDGLFQREVGSAPLLQRGWVVQEFILACRVVNFSQNQIYWQCKELSASESYPNGLPRSMGVTDRNIHTEIQNLRLSRRNPSLNTVGDRVELWNMLIYRYTQSSLSKSSDKLPALSGVVNYLRDIFPGEYHAGIWQDSIHLYLTWYCVGQYGPDFRPRPAEYRAPTWSWASTDNPVKVLRELRFGDSSKVRALVSVLKVETTLSTANSTGSVSGGQLLVQGPLSRMLGSLSDNGVMYHRIEPVADEPGFAIDVHYDEPPSLLVGSQGKLEAFVLPVYLVVDEDGTVFLVLQPCKESPGSYVRIGIGFLRDNGHDWLMYSNVGGDAPCEEYLGPREGHRIRII